MIRSCKKNEKKNLEEYIGEDFEKCVYLYLDLKKYGFLDDSNVEIYADYDDNNNYTLIALLYFDCLHLYSKENNFCAEDTKKFISSIKPKSLFATAGIFKKLEEYFNCYYKYHTSNILKCNKKFDLKLLNNSAEVVPAGRNDLDEIAKLVVNDEVFCETYTFDTLIKQFRQRYDDKFSRFFIIRDNGKLAGIACTGAEYDNIAIGNMSLVDKNYRGKHYGKLVSAYMYNSLIDDGFDVFHFPASEATTKFHMEIGHEYIGKIYRMTIK